MTSVFEHSSQIVAIANRGFRVSAAIIELGGPRNDKARTFANETGEVAITIGDIGQKIQCNESLIKWSEFDKIFGPSLSIIEKFFEKCSLALQKAMGDIGDLQPNRDDVSIPGARSYWQKFECAVDAELFGKEKTELEDGCESVRALQSIIRLAVLQSIGRNEALSTEQRSELVVIKGNIMWLLKTLRDNGLLSIGIHANVPAVASHLDFVQSHTENLSCSSKDVSSVTKPNESVLSLTKSLGGSTKTSLVPAPVTIKCNDENLVPETIQNIIYEAWSLSPVIKQRSQVTIKMFGICRQVSAITVDDSYRWDPLPGSQDELKAYASKVSEKRDRTPRFEKILEEKDVHCTLTSLLQARDHACRGRFWTIEAFTEMPQAKHKWFKKAISPAIPRSYLLILKGGDGVEELAPTTFKGNPFLRKYRTFAPPNKVNARTPPPLPHILTPQVKATLNFQLNQREAENVVNEFLASFSFLFVEIPYEQRGAILESVDMPPDYDSDDTLSLTDD